MSVYVVEWYDPRDPVSRESVVETDGLPSAALFKAVISQRTGVPEGSISVSDWLLQNEPRGGLNGRWGNVFRN